MRPRPATRARQRGLLALAILLAWGLGVGMLVRKEFFRERSAVLAEAALRLAPGVSFFIVERDGRQVGFASTTIDTSTTTFEVVDYLIADPPTARADDRESARAAITLSRSLALRTFEVEADGRAGARAVGGRAEGDSAIVFSRRQGSEVADSQRVVLGGPVLLPTLVPAVAMLTSEPEVGERVVVPTFDPATRAPRDVRLRFDAESLFTLIDSARFDSTTMRFVPALLDTVRAWRLVAEDSGDFTGWVDALGRVVETTRSGGLRLRRVAYEMAFENWRRDRAAVAAGADPSTVGLLGAPSGGAFEGTAIAAGALPSGAGPSTFRLRLAGGALDAFDLQGGRQSLHGDTLVVHREQPADLDADWSLTDRGDGFRQRFAAELSAEPLLQARDRAISALAVRIAGAERDPRAVAERINRWVHDSLRKAVTVTVPNAVQVMRARRGDTGEHTQLFTALARSIGIPTRIATGLVYVDGRFHYHAWPEVRLRDWVAVDPTFGQFPADAAHVRLVRGRLEREGELLRRVGSLRLEVLDPR